MICMGTNGLFHVLGRSVTKTKRAFALTVSFMVVRAGEIVPNPETPRLNIR